MAAGSAAFRTLDALIKREREAFVAGHPKSAALYAGADHLFGRVPMTWMNKWAGAPLLARSVDSCPPALTARRPPAGGFPPYLVSARGCRVTDADGKTYVDFALGDTGCVCTCGSVLWLHSRRAPLPPAAMPGRTIVCGMIFDDG